jgi:hypothetical protein
MRFLHFEGPNLIWILTSCRNVVFVAVCNVGVIADYYVGVIPFPVTMSYAYFWFWLILHGNFEGGSHQ